MQALLKQAWWALLIGGLASVLFGVLAFLWPGLTLFILAVFFAATVFVDGVVTMASAVKNRATASHWWLWLLLGLLGVVAGAIGLLSPATAAGALLLLISAYAIVTGVLMIWAGFKLRTEIEREWLLLVAGRGVGALRPAADRAAGRRLDGFRLGHRHLGGRRGHPQDPAGLQGASLRCQPGRGWPGSPSLNQRVPCRSSSSRSPASDSNSSASRRSVARRHSSSSTKDWARSPVGATFRAPSVSNSRRRGSSTRVAATDVRRQSKNRAAPTTCTAKRGSCCQRCWGTRHRRTAARRSQ